MTPQDLLDKLPSLDELVEHPRVRAATDRWNRSAAAARVRGALSSFRAEASKLSESMAGLTPADLIERFVQQIESPREPATPGVINATGRIGGEDRFGPPLPGEAIDALAATASRFREPREQAASAAALRRLLKTDGAAVFTSHATAVKHAIGGLAGEGGVCVVARDDLGELAPGVRLSEIIQQTGATLADADAATPEAYASALDAIERPQDRTTLLRRARRGEARATTAELTPVARRFGAWLVEDLGPARPREDTPVYGLAPPSAELTLAEGANLVVLEGSGLIGGPRSGCVAGNHEAVIRITGGLSAKLDRCGDLVDAALAATLDLFANPEQLRFRHPLYELLDAPLENLRTRAERLAPQLRSAEAVEACEAVELPGEAPSWGLEIHPEGGDPERLVTRLSESDPGVVVIREKKHLVADLRSVFPRQETDLLRAFGAGPAE